MQKAVKDRPKTTGKRLFFVSGLLKGHEAARMIASYLRQEDTKKITINELGVSALCQK